MRDELKAQLAEVADPLSHWYHEKDNPPPSPWALENASRVLAMADEAGLEPTRVLPDCEGGIAVMWVRSGIYADIGWGNEIDEDDNFGAAIVSHRPPHEATPAVIWGLKSLDEVPAALARIGAALAAATEAA